MPLYFGNMPINGVKTSLTNGQSYAKANILDTLPEASASLRGSFVIVPNGNTDKLYICMNINGAYDWFEFNATESNTSTTSILGRAVLGVMKLGG